MKPYYERGGVTIYHGDCREVFDSQDFQERLPDISTLITDPPYGMAFVSSKTIRRPIVGDHDESLRDEVLSTFPWLPAAVFGTWRVPRPVGTRQVITWFKASVGPGMGDLSLPWGNATEEIYIIGSGWSGRRRPNLITTSEQRGGAVGVAALLGHPTPKPVGLMTDLVECAPMGGILDPFMGVGATLLAAKNLSREAIGIEIEERYCEIAAQRLSQEVLPL